MIGTTVVSSGAAGIADVALSLGGGMTIFLRETGPQQRVNHGPDLPIDDFCTGMRGQHVTNNRAVGVPIRLAMNFATPVNSFHQLRARASFSIGKLFFSVSSSSCSIPKRFLH